MNERTQTRFPAKVRHRGVVLIFTVAVLVLLAVIATAYLATARIDRVYLDQKGGALTVGSSYGGGGDDALPGAIFTELRRDVFDWSAQPAPPTAQFQNPNWRYRPSEGTTGTPTNTYFNYDFLAENPAHANDMAAASHDRQANDPYLASRTPAPYNGAFDFTEAGGSGYYPAWMVVSRWLEYWNDNTPIFDDVSIYPNNIGAFESPYNANVAWPGPAVLPARTAVAATPAYPMYRHRHAAIPTYLSISYPALRASPKDMEAKTRVFPAFRFPGDPNTYLAGDTDGDGVADAGLFPLDYVAKTTLPPNGLFPDSTLPADFYPGDPNPHHTRYYAAIRVVDNGGSINLNTAYRRDFDPPAAPIGSDPDTGSPVALGTPSAGAYRNYGFFRSNIGLIELLRTPSTDPDFDLQWNQFMQIRFGGNSTQRQTGRNDYAYTTRAEALEMNVGRRPQKPASPFKGFDKGLSANLAFLNGMINPQDARTDYEKGLFRDLYRNSPNWGALDLVDEQEKANRSFTFFAAPSNSTASPSVPANSPMLWWHSMYNKGGNRVSDYFGSNAPGYTPTPLPIRHLVTTANPQTSALRPTDGVASPTWLKNSTTATTGMTPFRNGVRPKGSINTDDFGTLWRDFYQVMADPNNPAQPDSAAQGAAGLGDAGNATLLGPSSPELLYLRSALAAVNAMDMRDADDDITTYKIDIGSAVGASKPTMVAGCERHLYISNVVASGGTLKVTLRNPYKSGAPMKGVAYQLAIAGGGPYTAVTPVGTDVAADSESTPVTVDANGIAAGDLVLLRTRLADGTPKPSAAPNAYDETIGVNDWVPVDIVRLGNPSAVSGTYSRTTTDWKIASTGGAANGGSLNGIAGNGAVLNPVALDNMPGPFKANPDAVQLNQFPFGGFARNGDMMLIPYAGTFVTYQAGGLAIDQVSPMTLDVQTAGGSATGGQLKARFTPVPTSPTDWRCRLFDNFTAQANPMAAFTPNIAPESWMRNQTANAPAKVSNVDSMPDELVPVQGLININTAGLDVLKMVPWITDTNGTVLQPANDNMAAAILDDRRLRGPFKSVLDLNRVANFKMTGAAPNMNQGNFLANDPVMGDYATAFHNFIRVSNLVTTRSDSFIVYVLLQQWQDFGTNAPVLLSESRYAAVVDRSQLRDSNKSQEVVDKQSIATD